MLNILLYLIIKGKPLNKCPSC